MSCQPNSIIKWGDIYEIGTKLDAARDALGLAGSVPRMLETNPLFAAPQFVKTTIDYHWHFDHNTVQTPCLEIIEHGLNLAEGYAFEVPEIYAYEKERLYFIGALPQTGVNANAPCFCCTTGLVVPGQSQAGATRHTYRLEPDGKPQSCTNSPTWYAPCDGFFGLPAAVQIGDARDVQAEVNGVYTKKFLLCDGSTKKFTAGYKWSTTSPEGAAYRLAYISIPLTGFFGWDIQKSDFDDIKARMEEILNGSCGAKFEDNIAATPGVPAVKNAKVYEKLLDNVFLAEGCPVDFETYVWTVINKDNPAEADVPGCVKVTGELSKTTAESEYVPTLDTSVVLLPWESATCGATSECAGQRVYCATIRQLQLLADKLTFYLLPKVADCPLSADCEAAHAFIEQFKGSEENPGYFADAERCDGRLYIVYSWKTPGPYVVKENRPTEGRTDLDTNTSVAAFDERVGYLCENPLVFAKYLLFRSGDDVGDLGGKEAVIVDILKAAKAEKFGSSVEITCHAHWYDGLGKGNAEITVVYNCKMKGKVIEPGADALSCATKLVASIVVYDDGSFTLT